jgi:hypothetical protein
MRICRLFRLGVILLVMAGVAWIALQLWAFNNCNQIVPGMSRENVYYLLAGPGWQPHCGFGIPEGEHPEFWEWPGYSIRVDFDDNGRVIRTQHWAK